MPPERRWTIGQQAKARVQRNFLGSRHLVDYVEICADLL